MIAEVTIIIISLLASAFFSGLKVAFVSSDKLRLELDKSKDPFNAAILGRFLQNPEQFIATMLTGNILTLVLFCVAFLPLSNSFFSELNPVLTIVVCAFIFTLIYVILADLLPKTFFRINPNKALKTLSIPAALFYFLLYPFVKIVISFSKKVLRSNNSLISTRQDHTLFGKSNLNNFNGETETGMETQFESENEIKLFKNALDFSRVRVRESMIQRPDMEIIEDTADIEQLKQKFIQTGYSKILIYRESIDNIIGYVHSYDLFNQPSNIESCLREVSFVPETMEVKKLLSRLLREHKSIAIVVDEFGGTAGMITTEDILEEIFGEIEDEHDKPDIISRKISDKHYIFSGRLEIESINELYNLNLQADNSYETLAGYILFHHSSFPRTNAVINIGKYDFRILRSTKTSIELVELKLSEKS